MTKSKLWIVAGCNGAGKSSFSRVFVESNIIPFDYDAYFLKFCFSIFKGKVNYLKQFPEYLKKLIPKIYETVVK